MSTQTVDELLRTLLADQASDPEAVLPQIIDSTRHLKWMPNPGPQLQAYMSEADILLFGGQAGPGKTDLILGLAFSKHQRSLIVRRQYTDLGAMTERAIEINGTRKGFSGSIPPKLRPSPDQLIEFGAASTVGDEEHWQGQPHDLVAFDEVVQFVESQVRFLMGWNRSTDPDQRCRIVMASNPPITSEGQWIIEMFAPWLNPTHDNPAKPGELRWFITGQDGKDQEVDGPEVVRVGDQEYIPLSRTFIPGALSDNPFLASTGYKAQLDALPEPMRSAMRDGNFMAARTDDPWQLIPTTWILEAQARWTPSPPKNVPMCAIGVDIAQGGEAETVLAPRHDGWYAPLIAVPGRETPFGKDVAALVVKHRRDGATVILDMGGGYGGAAFEHLKDNNVDVVGYKGAEASKRRTDDRQLAFYNKRSEAYWQFREALDPSQPGGSMIALPPDPMLVADLAAPHFEVGSRGIQATPKEKIAALLKRSTDKGDAVIMAWSSGLKAKHIQDGWRPDQRADNRHTPKVIRAQKRRRR